MMSSTARSGGISIDGIAGVSRVASGTDDIVKNGRYGLVRRGRVDTSLNKKFVM